MARVEAVSSGYVVLAETEEELSLLKHAAGTLCLLEALYEVRENMLLLPSGISLPAARRACQAMEQAALSHREACVRRGKYHLIP